MICKYAAKGREPCSRSVLSDSDFCIVHQPLRGERVKCQFCRQMVPINSTRHQRVCSAVALVKVPYYSQDINVPNYLSGSADATLAGELLISDLSSLADKVESLYEEYVKSMLDSSNCYEKKFNDTPSSASDKHRMQEDAMISVLRRRGLLGGSSSRDDVEHSIDEGYPIYIDFGAGKGRLSRAIYMCETDMERSDSKSYFLCVERSGYKNKAERFSSMKTRSYRAQIDLKDVDLCKLLDFTETRLAPDDTGESATDSVDGTSHREIVGVGKHLCGNATDLALMSLRHCSGSKEDKDIASNASDDSDQGIYTREVTTFSIRHPEDSPTANRRIKGLCIALCCHSNCTWDCTVARKWLQEVGHISEHEFTVIKKWCGMFTMDGNTPCASPRGQHSDRRGEEGSRASYALSGRDPGQLGYMCKRLIDFGRLEYVRSELGLNGLLIRYIEDCITPENVALLAWI